MSNQDVPILSPQNPRHPHLIPIQPSTAGMVDQIDPRYLRRGQSAFLQNVSIDDPGRSVKREGSHLAATHSGVTDTFRGILDFTPDDGGSQQLVAVEGVNIRYAVGLPQGGVSLLASWALNTGSTGTAFEVTDKDDASSTFMIQARNRALVFNGTDLVHAFLAGGGVTTYPSASFPTGTCAEYMQERLFVSGRENNPNIVYYSQVSDITDFNAAFTNAVKFDIGRDSRIVALKKRKENQLIVFMDNAIEVLIQSFGNTTSTGTTDLPYGINSFSIASWIRQIIEPNVGCGARDSVVVYGDEILFIDDEGKARALSRTALDAQRGIESVSLSRPIEGTLPGDMNLSKMGIIQSIIFDDKWLIAYPSKTSTVNNRVAVFDLGLRVWMGLWSGLSVGKWVKTDIETASQERLYFTASNEVGRLYELLDGSFSDLRGDDAVVSGTAIGYEDRTKAFDFGSPSRKTWAWVEVEVEGTSDAQFEVFLRIDEGAEISLGSIMIGGGLFLDDNGTPPVLPNTLQDRPRQRKQFYLETKPRGVQAQLIFRESTDQKEVKFIGARFTAYIDPLEFES